MFNLLLAVIYLSFIGLGLPDSLLGAAWPAIYPQLNAAVSGAGLLSLIVAAGTVLSSLGSERLSCRLGVGRLTAFSVGLTAVALFGFSSSRSLTALCLWAVPYGLGAGSVDAALNNYVALHYASRHMNWLHCMWGVGASLGPWLMGLALSGSAGWQGGYRTVGCLQLVLTALLLLSLPLWQRKSGPQPPPAASPLSLRRVLSLPGAGEVMLVFFCYCALEQSVGLWASSYLTLCCGFGAERAAACAGLFFAGITVGRLLSGFLSFKLSDTQLVRLGQLLLALGLGLLLLPHGAVAALPLLGLGCAPIYPALLHATPQRFGAEHSQAVTGVQMASAYIGTCAMPPLFGLLARAGHTALLPAYLAAILLLMLLMHELLLRRSHKKTGCA